MSAGFLGIVCGLVREADCLAGLAGPDRLRVGIAAADADRAEREARRLCEDGAGGLMSFGLCGGLDPDLLPGELVAPERILTGTGGFDVASWRPEAPVRRIGAGLGSDTILARGAEKSAAHRRSGAAVVDMESHRVALVAHQAGVPFYVLRAVCDPAGTDIPAAAVGVIGPDGRPRLSVILGRLMRRPGQLAGLVGLQRDARAATIALRHGGRAAVKRLLDARGA